jgi:hypothetical protein
MRTIANVFMFLLTFAIVSNIWADARERKEPITDKGETIVAAFSSKFKVRVTIQTTRIPGRLPFVSEEELGSNTNPTVIKMISITINGTPLFVSRSAFADLVDPREARISFQSKQVVLTVWGGDAADSYIMRLYFDRKAVWRRTLSSAIPPPVVTEETRYRLRTLRDD